MRVYHDLSLEDLVEEALTQVSEEDRLQYRIISESTTFKNVARRTLENDGDSLPIEDIIRTIIRIIELINRLFG
jgi:hypothetical protein